MCSGSLFIRSSSVLMNHLLQLQIVLLLLLLMFFFPLNDWSLSFFCFLLLPNDKTTVWMYVFLICMQQDKRLERVKLISPILLRYYFCILHTKPVRWNQEFLLFWAGYIFNNNNKQPIFMSVESSTNPNIRPLDWLRTC